MKPFPLRAADDSGGGGVPATHQDPDRSGPDSPSPTGNAPPPTETPEETPAPAPAPAAPPAATVVANAEVTEEALRLKQENEALRKSVKDREAQVAMVQDEYHRYKETVEKPTPEPAKARRFLRHE